MRSVVKSLVPKQKYQHFSTYICLKPYQEREPNGTHNFNGKFCKNGNLNPRTAKKRAITKINYSEDDDDILDSNDDLNCSKEMKFNDEDIIIKNEYEEDRFREKLELLKKS